MAAGAYNVSLEYTGIAHSVHLCIYLPYQCRYHYRLQLCLCYHPVDTPLLLVAHVISDPGSPEETPLLCRTIEGVGGEDTTGNIENLLRQSNKEGVSDVGGEGSKEETLTCEDGVSDVINVGLSKDSPKPPADCSNEMGEAITSAVVIGAQKIHDNNTNTNNLDFIFSHYPSHATLEPTME